MLDGEIEAFRMPRNALDVLAQQVLALCCERERTVEEIQRVFCRAGPYRELSRPVLESVLDMLSGRYPSSDFADLKPLLSWDRAADSLKPRRGALMLSRLNAGTIPDRGNYAVHLAGRGRGSASWTRRWCSRPRPGDNIMLGASTWRVEEIGRDRVVVSPAPGEPGRLPFLARRRSGTAGGAGTGDRRLHPRGGALGPDEAADWICPNTPLDPIAAGNLAAYIREQREHTGQVPSDRAILIERFRDELGDWRVCILTPFGDRIHAPWAMALHGTWDAGGLRDPGHVYRRRHRPALRRW